MAKSVTSMVRSMVARTTPKAPTQSAAPTLRLADPPTSTRPALGKLSFLVLCYLWLCLTWKRKKATTLDGTICGGLLEIVETN